MVERAKLSKFPRNASLIIPRNSHTISSNITFWISFEMCLVLKIWSLKHNVSLRCPWTFRLTCFYFTSNDHPYTRLLSTYFVTILSNVDMFHEKFKNVDFFFNFSSKKRQRGTNHETLISNLPRDKLVRSFIKPHFDTFSQLFEFFFTMRDTQALNIPHSKKYWLNPHTES